MNSFFDISLAEKYNSNSQKIRVLTETWTKKNIFCPNCGSLIFEHKNNKPVADFFCDTCTEDYELKSKNGKMGNSIQDGGYNSMIKRLESDKNPNFFFLNYNIESYKVINFAVIPKHYFTPEIITKRKNGLSNRPNYIMCSIDISTIPESGKIFYIKNEKIEKKDNILKNWKKTLFLREQKPIVRGWTLDIMKCIDLLQKKKFTLDEMYTFDQLLSEKYPQNCHIHDKIRQQLQILRDKGFVEFLGNGKYKKL